MIFDMKKYVPEVYADSRDYRVFLKLFGLISTSLKYNIDSLANLYNADECPDNLLPFLADLVGYTYNDEIPVEYNRMIIKYFTQLITERGSTPGIWLAAALGINTSRGSDYMFSLRDTLRVEYDPDYSKGLIKIYYSDTDLIDRDLLEVVRPLGSSIELVPADIMITDESLYIKAKTNNQSLPYTDERHTLDKNNIGFGELNDDVTKPDMNTYRVLEDDETKRITEDGAERILESEEK